MEEASEHKFSFFIQAMRDQDTPTKTDSAREAEVPRERERETETETETIVSGQLEIMPDGRDGCLLLRLDNGIMSYSSCPAHFFLCSSQTPLLIHSQQWFQNIDNLSGLCVPDMPFSLIET